MEWFDAHLDLAYLAQCGRDMTLPLEQANRAPEGPKPAAVTLPSLAAGGVRWALATIYVSPTSAGEPYGYAGPDDVAGAHAAGVAQLRVYQEWEARGLVRIVRRAAELRDLKGQPESGPVPFSEALNIILLMEGADPIRTPEEAGWWFEQGVRVVGLSWVKGTRYAGGDGSPAEAGGLSDAGRALVRSLDQLGVIHDLSHLHDLSAWQLLELATGPVVATHTTSRRLQGNDRQRFISDELIKDVAQRGGIIGLPLYSPFLAPPAAAGGPTGPKRATLARAVDHVEYIAAAMGGRGGVGLGSDMDGGFGADEMPQGIDSPSDLHVLSEALAGRGWSAAEVEGFAQQNWHRYMAANIGG